MQQQLDGIHREWGRLQKAYAQATTEGEKRKRRCLGIQELSTQITTKQAEHHRIAEQIQHAQAAITATGLVKEAAQTTLTNLENQAAPMWM